VSLKLFITHFVAPPFSKKPQFRKKLIVQRKKQRFQNGNAVEKINNYLFENWLVCDRCLWQTKGTTRA